jgi:hypothetical protein
VRAVVSSPGELWKESGRFLVKSFLIPALATPGRCKAVSPWVWSQGQPLEVTDTPATVLPYKNKVEQPSPLPALCSPCYGQGLNKYIKDCFVREGWLRHREDLNFFWAGLWPELRDSQGDLGCQITIK